MKPKDVAKIINDCFSPTPEIKAAQILYSNGVTEDEFLLYNNSTIIQLIDVSWRCKVRNALRDIERQQKEKS
jgi:hypothetical protein